MLELVKEYTKDWKAGQWGGFFALLGTSILLLMLLVWAATEGGFIAVILILAFFAMIVGGFIWVEN